MGSHNEFHRDVVKYVIIITVINMIIAFLNGLNMFLMIGHMMEKYSLSLKYISKLSTNGLIFVAYPEGFGSLRYPQLTCSIFYLMIFILGIYSLFVMIKSIISGFIDIFPAIEETKYHRVCFIILFHIICAFFPLYL